MIAAEKPAEKPTVQRGLKLPCPHCGAEEAGISFHLIDESFVCNECDHEFTAANIRQLMAAWQPVLAWVEAFPRGE